MLASQPALTLTNPIVAAVFGVAVFGEHTRTGGWLVAAFLAAALIVGATALLARSPMLDDARRCSTMPVHPSQRPAASDAAAGAPR